MKYFALFNFDSNAKIDNMLAYNIYQRMHYLTDVEFLNVNRKKELIKILKDALKTKDDLTVITERNIFGLVGFLLCVFYPRVRWIVDIQDCPFKESISFYRHKPIKRILSFAKGKLVYFLYQFADEIIVSYSRALFEKHYKGSFNKVTFLANALPNLEKSHEPNQFLQQDKIIILYHGARLPEYGVELAEQAVRKLNSIENKFELHIYGLDRLNDDESINDNSIFYHGKRPRSEILAAIKNAHIGIAPYFKGSDIAFTFPIKAMEYYCYGNKLILSDCTGMLEMFAGINTEDITYFKAGDLDSLCSMIEKSIHEIEYRKLDKIRDMTHFSAEKKHQVIWEKYLHEV
jgi:glycosyltransferase involved in cell wall biosynthesis